MKNLFFLLLIILFSEFQLHSQTDSSFLNFETSTQLSLLSVEYNRLDEFPRQLNRYDFSFGIGIQHSVLFSINDKWQLSSGVGWNTQSYAVKIDNKLLTFPDFLGISYTPISTDSITTFKKVRYNSSYFNIPMEARFYLVKKPKFQFFVDAGINHLLLLSSSSAIKVLVIPPGIGVGGLFLTNTDLPVAHGLNAPIRDFFDKQVKKYALDGLVGVGYEFSIFEGKVWFGHVFSYQHSIVAKNKLMINTNGINTELKLRYLVSW